jgi:hypothetical protein
VFTPLGEERERQTGDTGAAIVLPAGNPDLTAHNK